MEIALAASGEGEDSILESPALILYILLSHDNACHTNSCDKWHLTPKAAGQPWEGHCLCFWNARVKWEKTSQHGKGSIWTTEKNGKAHLWRANSDCTQTGVLWKCSERIQMTGHEGWLMASEITAVYTWHEIPSRNWKHISQLLVSSSQLSAGNETELAAEIANIPAGDLKPFA